MNNSNLQAPYCKSAIFTCSYCYYSTTIYSDTEWFEVAEELYCNKCSGACDINYDAGIIYRDDIEPEIPLHMQMSTFPPGKHHCKNCIQHKSRMHWTEQLVHCHTCDRDTMVFTKYIPDNNILQFYEQCVDSAKPAHPPIEWGENNENKIVVISGTGEGFSST